MKALTSVLLWFFLLPCMVSCTKPAETPSESTPPSQTTQPEENTQETEPEEPSMQKEFYITAGGQTFTARFENNSSADALHQLLSQGDLTVDMSDTAILKKWEAWDKAFPQTINPSPPNQGM